VVVGVWGTDVCLYLPENIQKYISLLNISALPAPSVVAKSVAKSNHGNCLTST
jgi:hypothetical protein